MADSTADPITIDRTYFETLLRRANYNEDAGATRFHTNAGVTVSVPKEEYEMLLLFSRQFENLKRSLLGAGVTEENIAVLVQDATTTPQPDPYAIVTDPCDQTHIDWQARRPRQTGGQALAFQAASYSTDSPTADGNSGNISYFNGSKQHIFDDNHDWSSHEHQGGGDFAPYSADGPMDGHANSFHQPRKAQPHARICNRTVNFCGLPPFTTLADVTSVVRGGKLLDVFLRNTEHVASVSFVQENDAAQFYDHARKNDIYIRNKRISIKWAERHFILPGHVANKIAAGATRNLIIRRCGPSHTEDSVREDLDHIHNLIVVKVEFVGGSCYIKTNSVHNAMFARTCMMSRAKYKGSKIEWDIDECDQPFEVIRKEPMKPPSHRVPTKTVTSTRNRFDMLRLDDDDNTESDDKFDTSSEIPSTVDVVA